MRGLPAVGALGLPGAIETLAGLTARQFLVLAKEVGLDVSIDDSVANPAVGANRLEAYKFVDERESERHFKRAKDTDSRAAHKAFMVRHLEEFARGSMGSA